MDILVVALARKIKVILSLRGDAVRRAKSKLALEGRSLSDAVEEFLLTYETRLPRQTLRKPRFKEQILYKLRNHSQ